MQPAQAVPYENLAICQIMTLIYKPMESASQVCDRFTGKFMFRLSMSVHFAQAIC